MILKDHLKNIESFIDEADKKNKKTKKK